MVTVKLYLAQSPPMTSKPDNLFSALGVLRTALLSIALLNLVLPSIEILFGFSVGVDKHTFWSVLTGVITPAMAPLLVVVILFDYIMSRVRAADAEGAMRAHYIRIGRVELMMIGITLAFWIPYFYNKLN
jgi:hypothetical protein